MPSSKSNAKRYIPSNNLQMTNPIPSNQPFQNKSNLAELITPINKSTTNKVEMKK